MPEIDKDVHLTLLKQINDKTNKTDERLEKLIGALQEVAVSMAGLQTSHEHVQKQQLLQKERDEHQDFKIDCIESDVHTLEKDMIPLKSVPEKLSKLKDTVTDNKGRVEALEKKVESQEKLLKDLEKEQVVDSYNWKTLKGVGSFLSKHIVPPVLSAVGALLIYIQGFKG